MKFSNGTEFRFGTPKYKNVNDRLILTGGSLAFIFQFIFPKAPNWVSGIGWLILVAGLVVLLVGTIAERKEWEAKQKIDAK